MARIDMGDVTVGVGVGLFNRFGPQLVSKLPVIGTWGAKIMLYGPAAAGLAMTYFDYRAELGRRLTLAGLPQATVALLNQLMPPVPMLAGFPTASRYVPSTFVGAAPEPTERRGL